MLRLFYVYLFALAAGSSTLVQKLKINELNMPITDVHYNTNGMQDHQRVIYLKAVIYKRHVNTGDRIDFPTSGYLDTYFKEAKADGDERGHLVGSQFSGPAEWYNLSPQNSRVNRNEGYQSITTEWYGTECEVRRFLDQTGGERHVVWEVNMTYEGNSNRPKEYILNVAFFKDGKEMHPGIYTKIPNPFLLADDMLWICRICGSTRHNNDEIRRGVGCTRKK